MGTVHGVYLKYVGISAFSFVGYSMVTKKSRLSLADLLEITHNALYGTLSLVGATNADNYMPVWKAVPALVLGYSTILNGVIAVLFKLEWGMGMLGKNKKTGQIPLWSYIVFFPFHFPSILYTHLHLSHGKQKIERDGKVAKEKVPLASEVQPGWYVGSCQSHKLHKEWSAVIDLTSEFPETCINQTRSYLNIPTWDGVPCSPTQLEEAANFAVQARRHGDVLVHCAHGRGRSTTVMCACLVKAGLFKTWLEAFEEGIQPFRPCCKLNRRMRQALAQWQSLYVDKKHAS